jgi:hypothetical protein
MINRKNTEALTGILKNQVFPIKEALDVRRNTYLTVDKYLQKESDRTTSGVTGRLVNELGDKSKIRDAEVPVAFIQSQTAIAYLMNVFLGGEPIFAATANRKNEKAAAMLTAMSQRDQHRLNWRGEILQSLADAVQYNLAPMEVYWGAKRASSVKTVQAAPNSTRTGEIAAVTYEGNFIKRRDPYNVFCDMSVAPYEVHEHGAFAGYIERFNYIRMKKFVAELNNVFVVKHNLRTAFTSSCGEGLYYHPQVRSIFGSVAPQENNWQAFWGTNPSIDPTQSGGKYEVVTLYARIIPKEYNIEVPRAGSLATYKLIYVNGTLLYVEPLNTPHEYLPLIFGQMYRGNWDKKSFTEYVLDLQDLGTSMIRGTMDSMRRAVADRGIYDPTRVRKADMDSPNPVAKIPVTTNAYNQDIRTAYYPIPYEDRASGNFRSNFGLVLDLANQTTGQNQAAQGNFIRGNKTMQEFDSIMTNSQARMQLGALELDASLFAPTRLILNTNFLLYAQAEKIEDRITGDEVEVDPAMLRKVLPEFKMSSAVLPTTKVANTEVALQALQLFSQRPELDMEYDTGGIAVSILMQQGMTDLEQYKRTPEQMKQKQAQLEAQAAAAAAARGRV